MEQWRKDKPWFHGSPLILEELLAGSTITQDRQLADIFSHKPTIVAVDDNGVRLHNGKRKGYVYVIDEQLSEEDLYPHPSTTMQPGDEWLIKRPLKVRRLYETEVGQQGLLTEEDEIELFRNDAEMG